jgi:hypothetical protein
VAREPLAQAGSRIGSKFDAGVRSGSPEACWTIEYENYAIDKGMERPWFPFPSIMADGEGRIHISLK